MQASCRERNSVRGLVRATSDQAAVDRLRELGVETVRGDVRDPDSLDTACRGVRTVVSTVTITRSRQPGDSIEATDEAGQIALVDASRKAGVERFVFVSYSANLDDDGPLTREARRTTAPRVECRAQSEAELLHVEVWLSPISASTSITEGDGVRAGSADKLHIPWRRGGVRRPRRWDQTLKAQRSSWEDLTRSAPEAVRIFEELGGAPFEVQHVPEKALRAQFDAATDSLQKSFAGLMLDYAHGDEIPMEETRRRIPVKLTSVRDYARNMLGV
jgi:NADH dehydrogenase